MVVENHDLSIIIISRNEEKNIANCIESILKAAKKIVSYEIILVDSASTDRTVEIAMKYPIRIIKLHPSCSLSPAAGYYVGFMNTNGKYVQFQCGDTILNENWFENALPVLERESKLAGVVGAVTQEKYDSILARRYFKTLNNLPVGEVTDFWGDSLFKREVLFEVGPYNPHLMAGEEGELCFRVIDKGYKFMRLPFPMSHHTGCHENSYTNFIQKLCRYTIAQGQVMRYSLNRKQILLWRLNEFKFKIISGFLIIFGLFSILWYFKINDQTIFVTIQIPFFQSSPSTHENNQNQQA